MTTIENVENYLKKPIDEGYKPTVQQFIDSVTAYIERYTGRTFTTDESATARTYDGTGANELIIDDAAEITEVKIDDTVLDVTDFFLLPSNRLPKTRIILPYKIFACGIQNITVTAKWGYGSVPDDLSFAATVMVAGIINSQDNEDKDIQSETIGRYSVTYRANSSQQSDFTNSKNILKLYRRMS